MQKCYPFTVLRLLAFLVTGFWPSAKSLMALNRRVDDLGRKLETLTKRHNSLAGSYYNDFGEGEEGPETVGRLPKASPDFPDEEFNRLVEEKKRHA